MSQGWCVCSFNPHNRPLRWVSSFLHLRKTRHIWNQGPTRGKWGRTPAAQTLGADAPLSVSQRVNGAGTCQWTERPGQLESGRRGVFQGLPRAPDTQGPRERRRTNGTTRVSGAGGDAFAEDFRGGAWQGRKSRAAAAGHGRGRAGRRARSAGLGSGAAQRAAGTLGQTHRPRGHEPGAAAEASPAVPGPGGWPGR